jgi:hypothetical protein
MEVLLVFSTMFIICQTIINVNARKEYAKMQSRQVKITKKFFKNYTINYDKKCKFELEFIDETNNKTDTLKLDVANNYDNCEYLEKIFNEMKEEATLYEYGGIYRLIPYSEPGF